MKEKKSRLIPIVSVLLVTGFLLTSLASYFVSRASLRKQISQNELPLTSDNIYSEIQRDLLRPIFISSLMATDTFLRDWMIDGEKDTHCITKYLREIKEKYGAFTSFLVSEKTRIYYQAGGILKEVHPDNERDIWYFRVRQMKQEYEINIDPDMAHHDTMTIFVNYRVYDYDGNYIGATGVGLAVDAVTQLVESYQKDYDRSVYFVDRQGTIRLHGEGFGHDAARLSDIEGLSPLAGTILSSTEERTFIYENKGHTIHLNTRYIPEFDWYLLVEQREDEAKREIRSALFVNIVICAVITIIILIMTNLTISAYHSRLETMATTDSLTSLYNRHAFDIIMDKVLKSYDRRSLPLSVIIFDVDKFKDVNDTFGHTWGDAVLKHVAALAKRTVRSSDIIFRWGGEEFLILLEDCPIDKAYDIAEKLRRAVIDNPTRHGVSDMAVTISLGVAQYRGGEDEDTVLRRADRALYRAKETGRNRTERETAHWKKGG